MPDDMRCSAPTSQAVAAANPRAGFAARGALALGADVSRIRALSPERREALARSVRVFAAYGTAWFAALAAPGAFFVHLLNVGIDFGQQSVDIILHETVGTILMLTFVAFIVLVVLRLWIVAACWRFKKALALSPVWFVCSCLPVVGIILAAVMLGAVRRVQQHQSRESK